LAQASAVSPCKFCEKHLGQPFSAMSPLSLIASFFCCFHPWVSAASHGPHGHPSPGFDYPQYDNFTLWLVEEFDIALDLNTDDIWTWSDGGLSEGNVRFVKEALKFEGGKLVIEASQQPPIVPPQQCSHAEDGFVSPKPLTSGEMRTKHNMFRYGRYEVNMKAPTVQNGDANIDGNFIATMFAFRDGKFHHWREIDIEVTGDAPNSVATNVLNADYTDQWSPTIAAPAALRPAGVNVRAGFHTFAFEWLPSGVTWFFDGAPVRSFSAGQALHVPDMSVKIMMNLWMFAGPPYGFGGPDGQNNRYPMRSEYDWFRFYKWDGDLQYPCKDADPSCLTAEDWYMSSNNPCDGIKEVGDQYRTPCEAACPYPENELEEILV